MYQDPEIEEEAITTPWWLAVAFAVVGLASIYWILKAAFYFSDRLLGIVWQ